jgi:hypothetical protein
MTKRPPRTPIVLDRDSLQGHKGEVINESVLPRSSHLEYLPPYAPHLNPVEYSPPEAFSSPGRACDLPCEQRGRILGAGCPGAV